MLAFLFALAVIQAPESDIVITGTRLDDAYAACLAGRCDTLRDARVSIAWAEQAFRRGDYMAAKRGLAAAVARNRGAAATAPKPVAALYEAYATVTLQEGDLDVYYRSVSAQVRTLRDNLPADDPAVSDAELALGDMWMKAGDTNNARAAYERAQTAGIKYGQSVTALSAGLRLVMLANQQGRHAEASRLLEDLARSSVAQEAGVQALFPAFRLRLAVRRADKKEVDRQIAAMARTGNKQHPILISSPPLGPVAATAAQDHADKFGDVRAAPVTFSGLSWADIGFWIRPTGRTADVEVVRSSGAGSWTRTATDQISGRRYAAFTDEGAGQGVYRVERYTLRGSYEVPTDSLIRQRVGPQQIEMLDITDAPDAPVEPSA